MYLERREHGVAVAYGVGKAVADVRMPGIPETPGSRHVNPLPDLVEKILLYVGDRMELLGVYVEQCFAEHLVGELEEDETESLS